MDKNTEVVSANVINKQAAPNTDTMVSVNKRDLDDLLCALDGASTAFDQLDTVLKLIQKALVNNDVQNLAGIGRESAATWFNHCDISQADFKREYGLTEQEGN